MALLEVENLRTHFRTPEGVVRAVDGVSFHLDKGETLALVGESGCGKSTTARLVLRLIEQTTGKVEFESTDITTMTVLSNSTLPVVGSIRRSTRRAVVDLPQPDSPTSASVSPLSR